MSMAISMGLHEERVLDPRFHDYVNDGFAEYHVATNADIGSIEVSWIEESDHMQSDRRQGDWRDWHRCDRGSQREFRLLRNWNPQSRRADQARQAPGVSPFNRAAHGIMGPD
jgi:hypothetical protein